MAEDYTIVAKIVAADATTAGAVSAEKNLERVERKAQSVGFGIAGALGRAFAVLGGTAAVGGAVTGMISLNSEIETARNGLATLYTAMSGMPIGDSVRLARTELAGLQADARKGVGELGNYIEGYSKILGPALNAGMSLDFTRELNRNALAAGAALRGDQGLWMAPMDLTQALTTGVSDKTTPIVAAALGAAGIAVEKFNAMDAPKKFEALNDAFKKFAPGVELMGKSWSAQSSTMLDNLKELARTASAPLFDVWVERLRKANEWVDANRDSLMEIATTWGDRLVKLWEHLIKQASTYAAIVAGAALAQPATAVASAAGSRVSTLGPTLMAALRDPFGMSNVFSGGVMGTASGSPGIFALIGSGLKSIAVASAPLVIVAGALLSMKGAIEEYPSLLGYIERQAESLGGSLSRLGESFGTLTAEGSALNIVGGVLVGAFGLLAGAIDYLVVRPLASFIVGIGLLGQLLGDVMKVVHFAKTGQWDEIEKIDFMGQIETAFEAQKKIWLGASGEEKSAPISDADRAAMLGLDDPGRDFEIPPDLKAPKPPVNKGGDVNIYNPKFEVKTELNSDPDRVLGAVAEAVDKMRLYRRQAARLPALPG